MPRVLVHPLPLLIIVSFQPLEALDPRLTIIPISGYHWDAYECISAQGLLDDVQPTDWSQGIYITRTCPS